MSLSSFQHAEGFAQTVSPYIPQTYVNNGALSVSLIGEIGGAQTTYQASYADPAVPGFTFVEEAGNFVATQADGGVMSCALDTVNVCYPVNTYFAIL